MARRAQKSSEAMRSPLNYIPLSMSVHFDLKLRIDRIEEHLGYTLELVHKTTCSSYFIMRQPLQPQTEPQQPLQNTMIKSFSSIIFLALAATASTCPTNLPYSSSIVGRSYSMRQPCYPARFVAYGTASVSDTEIKYIPFYENFNHGGVNPGYVCPRTYIFKINKWAPMLTELPRLVAPDDSGPLDQYCAREQNRQKVLSWPQGSTRGRFISGMNQTIEGITYLRDHECWTPQYLPTLHTQEYLNAWLDGPITYLLSVAFNFGLCLHTAN